MQQLTPGVSISTSRLWATNTGIIRGPEGTVLVDAGVFEHEFEAIAAVARPVAAAFCTHAHWDHVLWHRALGEDVPRYATPETIQLILKDRDQILSNLANTEALIAQMGESDDFGLWDRTQLFREQPIPWGEGVIAGIKVDIIPIPGHEDGQAALLLPNHGVLFAADTLSDIETPSFHYGSKSIATYLDTLDTLQALIGQVEWIVPGHGKVADRVEAQRRLEADRRYLEGLAPKVESAPAGVGTEDLARRILTELTEERADSDLAWEMHVDNVRQLVAERGAT